MLPGRQQDRIAAFIEHVRLDIHTRMYRGKLHYQGDRRTLEKYIPMAEELGDRVLVGYLHLTLAMAHEFAGRLPEAIDSYEQVYQIFAQAQAYLPMAKARNNLAELHRLAGRYELALKLYDEASRLVKQCDEKNLLPLIESNIGLTWLEFGDYPHAEAHFVEAIRLVVEEKIENADALMEAYRGLGETYLATKAFEKAWHNVQMALELAAGMSDRITEAEVYLLCARLAEADPHSKKKTAILL